MSSSSTATCWTSSRPDLPGSPCTGRRDPHEGPPSRCHVSFCPATCRHPRRRLQSHDLFTAHPGAATLDSNPVGAANEEASHAVASDQRRQRLRVRRGPLARSRLPRRRAHGSGPVTSEQMPSPRPSSWSSTATRAHAARSASRPRFGWSALTPTELQVARIGRRGPQQPLRGRRPVHLTEHRVDPPPLDVHQARREVAGAADPRGPRARALATTTSAEVMAASS
jgi:hypothetical protein